MAYGSVSAGFCGLFREVGDLVGWNVLMALYGVKNGCGEGIGCNIVSFLDLEKWVGGLYVCGRYLFLN